MLIADGESRRPLRDNALRTRSQAPHRTEALLTQARGNRKRHKQIDVPRQVEPYQQQRIKSEEIGQEDSHRLSFEDLELTLLSTLSPCFLNRLTVLTCTFIAFDSDSEDGLGDVSIIVQNQLYAS